MVAKIPTPMEVVKKMTKDAPPFVKRVVLPRARHRNPKLVAHHR